MSENQDKKILLEAVVVPVINYALQQNKIDFVQSVKIKNETEQELEKVELRICGESDLVTPFVRMIDRIPAENTFEIKALPVVISGQYLAGLTEKVTEKLTISLYKEGELLSETAEEVTVLAFDQWHGYGRYPELLTAFVTPNHPALVKILARGAELLKEWTGDPSMDAYQTKDPNRVLKQAAAIFSAIKEENIVYSEPPASFENAGQRVRFCDAVLSQKFGTCLDLTLLYCSCLEAVGLFPIMIHTEGHIFSGVWLDELCFPDPVIYDPSAVTKRLAEGVCELAVMETTFATNGRNTTFDDARQQAEHAMTGTDPIECIIDVHRARISGISPLPLRVHNDERWFIEHNDMNDEEGFSAPKSVGGALDLSNIDEGENEPKIDVWERKLLDLGLRNTLINLRSTKSLVPILSKSLDELENALSSGTEFLLLSKPADANFEDEKFDFESLHDIDNLAGVVDSEFKNKRLRTVYTESETKRTLKNLYRTAKTSLEENGANTLYLALGLLRWYETDVSKRPRYAPIILLPVEIIRKSAERGFALRLRDEDAQMNITILEKIKQDFGITVKGLDPLPLDESGVDIRKAFTLLRKAVMEQPRWDILESAYLGIFSFSQFVMWNDLRNRREDLLKNKVVKSLVDGKLCWEAEAMEIGDRVSEEDVLLPMSADASQLYAIQSACAGKSFVLHGPPGTGKSQTITSLIANALAQGKSVLFVAEKMAALEVVQKRLENIGIGPFCLELHSNKAKKRNVLEQLRRVTEITKNISAEEYEAKAQQTAALRQELDSYAKQLHTPQNCGYTLFGLINSYEEYKNAVEVKGFPAEYIEKITTGDLEKHTLVLERLIAAAKAIGHPCGHPLSPIGLTEYRQNLKTALKEKVSAYLEVLKTMKDLFAELEEIPLGIKVSNISEMERLSEILAEMNKWYALPKDWAKAENLAFYLTHVTEMAGHFDRAAVLKESLLKNWTEEILTLDGEELMKEYNGITAKWVGAKFAGMLSLTKKLSPYFAQGVKNPDLGKGITLLLNIQREEAKAKELFETYGESLGRLYSGDNTDWRRILEETVTAKESCDRLYELTGSDELRITCCGEEKFKTAIIDFPQVFQRMLSEKKNCYELLVMEDREAEEGFVSSEISVCEGMLSAVESLKEWILFRSILAEAEEAGLSNVTGAYMRGLDHDDLIPAYRKAIFYALIVLAIDGAESLNSFSGVVFDEKIEQFRRIDKELTELSKKEIYLRLASKVPNFVAAAAHSSELGILQRMIKSGGRGTSIRKLFEDIATLLPRLCPCMLMSPISAAQYLDPKREAFDIVVFDEASQLPTCKAVGALARGKDAVIVGDPKQMPPTTFFAVNTVDEDNLDVEDLESILDDCLALNMPQTHLLWHYRSRHESLIAFSNDKFYENKLYTFPSVNDRESKVSLVQIDGVFERGTTRRNKAEAEAVVAEIVRRSHDPNLKNESIGVVTFNVPQQNLIDDLLVSAMETDSELEAFVNREEEPLFVKNLENVQGDERDVILFSVGYGPDEKGKVYMNFGPLNRDGGWRRLNVAVSRARREMVVFATLRPEQIAVTGTSSLGVVALKEFLEYAAGAQQPLNENTVAETRKAEGIVKTICEELNKAGYKTDTAVGHSQYRIDIGVIDPRNTEKYLLGILLDGEGYGSAKTTRDRELAQISVLGGLGWRIMRIWTMDWWDNPEREIMRVLRLLAELETNGDDDSPEAEISEEDSFEADSSEAEVGGDTITYSVEEDIQIEEEVQTAEEESIIIPYESAELSADPVSAERFTSQEFKEEIVTAINTVILKEAPVSRSVIIGRVLACFGILRCTAGIKEYLGSIFAELYIDATEQEGELFYWNNGQREGGYPFIRIANREEDRREPKDIPLIEAENALCYVVKEQVSLPEEELIREAAKVMGYTLGSAAIKDLFARAVKSAAQKGRIKLTQNGNWAEE